MRTNHKLLDLFSGIGGFSLGAERNGIETIGFVEKDKFCQKVLKKHWSDVPIIDDIRKVNGKDFGSATIISGGFPCQPFSVAGKREGTDDDRYLWDEMLRVISSCKPTWVIGENVEGLINIQDGMVLRSVQDDLEREGFQVQCLVIPASGIGAWHQRNRVWIIGYSEHNGSSATKEQRGNTQTSTGPQKREDATLQSERTSRPTDNGNVSNSNSGELHGCISTSRICRPKHNRMDSNKKRNGNEVWSETERCSSQNTERENVSDSESKRLERLCNKSTTINTKRKVWKDTRLNDCPKRNVTNTNSIRTQSKDARQYSSIKVHNSDCTERQRKTWWQTQSELRGVPNGVSYELHSNRTDRIKALGNSIVPQIAEQIFRSIIDAE